MRTRQLRFEKMSLASCWLHRQFAHNARTQHTHTHPLIDVSMRKISHSIFIKRVSTLCIQSDGRTKKQKQKTFGSIVVRWDTVKRPTIFCGDAAQELCVVSF